MSLRNRWAIATLTGAGVFVTYMLRFNISPIGQLISTDFHLSDFELGLLLSGSLWIYTLMQPVAGLITDRYGAKLSLLLGGLATSVLTVASGFAGSFLTLLGMRVIIGATQAPNFVTGASVTSSDWFNKSQKARATSIWIAGGRFGQVLTLPFAAWLGVAYGWQWTFIVTGLVGIAWCSTWYIGFQNNPPESPQSKRKPASLGIRKSFPAVLTPLGFGFALASFGQGYVAYYLNLWLPTYLVRQQKFTILNAGIFSSLPFIALVVTLILVGGVLSDYVVKRGASPVGFRRNLFSVGMVLTAVMLFATAYAPDPYSAVASISLAGACLGFSTPSLWVAMVESTPKEVTGAMGGIQNLGGNLAGIVVSILTGYVLQVTKSFFYALLAGAGVALLGAVAAFVLIRPRKKWALK